MILRTERKVERSARTPNSPLEFDFDGCKSPMNWAKNFYSAVQAKRIYDYRMDAEQLQDELIELQGRYNDSLIKIEELQIKHKIEVVAFEKTNYDLQKENENSEKSNRDLQKDNEMLEKTNRDLQKEIEMLEKTNQDLQKKVQEMKLKAEVANKLKQTPLPEVEKKKPTEARPLGPYGRPTKASMYRQKFNNQK